MSNQTEDPFTKIASKVNAVILEKKEKSGSNNKTADSAAAATSSTLGVRLDLWQPRDWPHRKGDEICLNLHSIPLEMNSPGRRPHTCEKCNRNSCPCIHDCILCWRCKGAFCPTCIIGTDINVVLGIKMESILKDGFAKCPACKEPLRSIGLIDMQRFLMEAYSGGKYLGFGVMTMGDKSEECNGDSSVLGSKKGQSLVQEAELALQRARQLRHEKNRARAINEYTHVINAINYYASISDGFGLVLRPHDLLLIAHCERADLEGNTSLADAILASYPKASVRSHEDGEEQFRVSRSGFRSLFYPLPARVLVGSPQSGANGFICLDLRTQSKEDAIASSYTKEQIGVSGGIQDSYQPLFMSMLKAHPHCDNNDINYNNLHGSWRGIRSYIRNPGSLSSMLFHSLKVGEENIQFSMFVHFVRVFPTATAAAEYTRIMVENKDIGEEGSLGAQICPQFAKSVKDKTKSLLKAAAAAAPAATGTSTHQPRQQEKIEMRQVHAIHVIHPGLSDIAGVITSVVAAVGNVMTKFCVTTHGASDELLCTFFARAFVHLHHQLENCRVATNGMEETTLTTTGKMTPFADMSLCAYCGKDDSAKQLKACTRCMAARYCNSDCQRSHWVTKGPNSHRTLCQSVKPQQQQQPQQHA